MSNPSFRIVIRQEFHAGSAPVRVSKNLCSVTPHRSGDVFLSVKNPGHFADRQQAWDANTDLPDPMREHRFTLHQSPNSTAGIMTIAEHDRRMDGREESYRQFSRAFKDQSKFALIHGRRCGPMHEALFSVEDDSVPQLSLGVYDPGVFTPMVWLACSHPDLELQIPKEATFSTTFAICGAFRVTAIWCFQILPTCAMGMHLTIETLQGQGSNIDGFDGHALLDNLRYQRLLMSRDLAEFSHAKGLPIIVKPEQVSRPTYVARADLTSRQYRLGLKTLASQNPPGYQV